MKRSRKPDPDTIFLAEIEIIREGINRHLDRLAGAVVTFVKATDWIRHSQAVKHGKANLQLNGLHQGGSRPFGWRLGKSTGRGKARELIPDEPEQAAIADILALRVEGKSLMAIRNVMRARGFPISHQLVSKIVARFASSDVASPGKPN